MLFCPELCPGRGVSGWDEVAPGGVVVARPWRSGLGAEDGYRSVSPASRVGTGEARGNGKKRRALGALGLTGGLTAALGRQRQSGSRTGCLGDQRDGAR